ncbi:unnamed protein product [Closterium sp. NIES-53]
MRRCGGTSLCSACHRRTSCGVGGQRHRARGDPLGAQADHGVPSIASSDTTASIDPNDTATSPDQVVRCPACRSSLANRRALQHHTPFCHPVDTARRAHAVHDTTSILPSLSQPRATGIQFTDAQWQTLDSVDWTEYFSPERIHARPLRRVPERVRGGYLDVIRAILARISQDPKAAGPTFLLAATPTLFLAPATPSDRSHTAAIATCISRFGREVIVRADRPSSADGARGSPAGRSLPPSFLALFHFHLPRFPFCRSELPFGGAYFGGRASPSHLSLTPCPFDLPSGRRCRSVAAVDVVRRSTAHPGCSCGQAIDDMTVPHHAVWCPRFNVTTTIHDTVKFMLGVFAVEAGFAVKVEDSTMFTQLEVARARQ